MILMNGLVMQKKDLEAAKFLTNMHPQPLEIICYHCQQSAEKILNFVFGNAL